MNANQSMFFSALKTAYADLFANDPAYAYSASKCTAVEMAEKMIVAAVEGRANMSGEGFKRACKACAIPHTQKSIDLFLSAHTPIPAPDAPPSSRAARRIQVIGLSNVYAAMSGVARINRAHDLVTLEYTDGTREAGKVSAARWAEICSEPFAIVSEIQAQRVPSN